MTANVDAHIVSHYQRPDHFEAIVAWLHGQGKDLNAITVDDLAPVDQFHGRQLAATKGLAELAQISSSMRIADLGGGAGGPARWLASNFGCSVDVVDLTPELCDIGKRLSDMVRLSDKVHFFCASATASGLESSSYDLVWMQNASMNIKDRKALYDEVRRVLIPGGLYAFQEAELGDNGEPYFPAGWASSADESFLLSPKDTLIMLLNSGFRILSWQDETEAMGAVRSQMLADSQAGTAPPNYMSPEKQREAAVSARRSSEEGRIRFGRGLFQRL